MAAPIEFFYWPTPNCWKVAIMLEELGAEYELRPVDIGRGDQYSAAYTAVCPNNRVPAISDPEPLFGDGPFTVFESGAILCYLAEKFGRFMPGDPQARYECLEWLFWQVGGLGPTGGQAHHFRLYARERIQYAIDRYTNECHRLYGVLESRLQDREFLVGDYSIADIACVPWIYRHERQGQRLEEFPALNRWYTTILARPAAKAGFALAAGLRDEDAFTSESARRILFEGKRPGL